MSFPTFEELHWAVVPGRGYVVVNPASHARIPLREIHRMWVDDDGVVCPTGNGPVTYRVLEACGPHNLTLLCVRADVTPPDLPGHTSR